MNEPTDEELMAIYEEANSIIVGQVGNWMESACLAAMRLAMEKARKEVEDKVVTGFVNLLTDPAVALKRNGKKMSAEEVKAAIRNQP